jgi:hypothetical protein
MAKKIIFASFFRVCIILVKGKNDICGQKRKTILFFSCFFTIFFSCNTGLRCPYYIQKKMKNGVSQKVFFTTKNGFFLQNDFFGILLFTSKPFFMSIAPFRRTFFFVAMVGKMDCNKIREMQLRTLTGLLGVLGYAPLSPTFKLDLRPSYL